MLDYVLTYEDTTGDFDAHGKIIPGTEKRVWVEMPMPPGLEESEKRNRAVIERALYRAVYELGMEEYGNKDLRVHQLGDVNHIEYVKTQVTRLLAPAKIDKLKDEKGAVVVTEGGDGAAAVK